MSAHRYEVTIIREGKWVMTHIPELDGLTQTRRLTDAEITAREWIASTLGKPLKEITVTINISKLHSKLSNWRNN